MRIGDGELDAVQPPGPQPAKERPPERLGLGLTNVQADDLAAAAVVDAVGDHQRPVAHPTRLTHALHVGVQPQVRVGARQRPLPEAADLLVQATAQPRDLILVMWCRPSWATSRSTVRVETPLT